MIQLRQLTIIVAISILLSVTSFWFGFNEGAKVGVMFEAIPRGAISLFQLNKLTTEGITENVLIGLESDVDMGLIWAADLERHPLLPILEPMWGLPVSKSETWLSKLANYRQSHPSPLRADVLANEPFPKTPNAQELRKEVLNGAKEHDQIISSMVVKHASPESQFE